MKNLLLLLLLLVANFSISANSIIDIVDGKVNTEADKALPQRDVKVTENAVVVTYLIKFIKL